MKAKLATIFAVVFLVSAGICGYSANHANSIFGPTLALVALVAMVISFFGLIMIGFFALFQLMFRKQYK